MSTKPVATKAEAAIKALSELSVGATKAVEDAMQSIADDEKVIGQVVHGAQVAVQHKQDSIEAAQHIIAQLSPKTATPTPPVPPTDDAAADPVAPVPPADNGAPAQPVTAVVPPADNGAPAPVPAPAPRRRNAFNPANWPWGSWWMWLLLILGLLAGLLVSGITWGLFVQDWYLDNDPKWLVAGIVLSVIHWVAFPAAGIMLGGAFASWIANRGHAQHAVPPIPAPAQPVVAVAPVQPAAAPAIPPAPPAAPGA